VLTSTRDTKDGNTTKIIAEAKLREQDILNMGNRAPKSR
jgi:hypothetical protein